MSPVQAGGPGEHRPTFRTGTTLRGGDIGGGREKSELNVPMIVAPPN